MPLSAQTPPPVGVPPLNGEPLPLEFVNTVFPVKGVLMDGFRTTEHLAWWLRSCRGSLATHLPESAVDALGVADVQCFVMLRDASRRLVDALVNCREADPWDVAHLNRAATMDRAWPLLCWNAGERPVAVHVSTAVPSIAVQSEIAHAVVRLLTGASGVEPKACVAPGCVFYFDQARSRREWCSTGCGNRARAARHYARRHPHRDC
ncbi:CGNR zinc finger domain-containing protein [Streptomyces sp. NPDC059957]